MNALTNGADTNLAKRFTMTRLYPVAHRGKHRFPYGASGRLFGRHAARFVMNAPFSLIE